MGCPEVFYRDNNFCRDEPPRPPRNRVDFEFPLPLDRQLGFGLYSAFMAVSRVYKPWLDKLGLTYPQYLVMCVLWEDDDPTIGGGAGRPRLGPRTMHPPKKRLG